jgi:hypothetical protein
MTDDEYNVFECLADGSFLWRTSVRGLASARLELHKLSGTNSKDHFAMNLQTRELVFSANAERRGPVAKRVFQIAYTEELRRKRADVLRGLGFDVLSVIGNEAAKTVLSASSMDGEVAYFMIGHAAPEQTRKEMLDWLKARYPTAKIIALNPPNQQLPGADYNVLQNGPEAWMSLVAPHVA